MIHRNLVFESKSASVRVGPNHVWSPDITYIPMRGGFLYLVAVMDWFSRFVLTWELSNTMETGFCLTALHAALRFGQPEIWNSDQGAHFTAADFLAPLKQRGILISTDGRGRALDNVLIERLWRSLKDELIYPGDFASGHDLVKGVSQEAMSLLMRYDWPGNVRELENAIEHAVVFGSTDEILPEDLPDPVLGSLAAGGT